MRECFLPVFINHSLLCQCSFYIDLPLTLLLIPNLCNTSVATQLLQIPHFCCPPPDSEFFLSLTAPSENCLQILHKSRISYCLHNKINKFTSPFSRFFLLSIPTHNRNISTKKTNLYGINSSPNQDDTAQKKYDSEKNSHYSHFTGTICANVSNRVDKSKRTYLTDQIQPQVIV